MNHAVKRVAVAGAGKIGSTIARLLQSQPDYQVTLIDADQAQLDNENTPGIYRRCVDVTNVDAVKETLRDHYAVLSAMPFFLTKEVARAAVAAKCHYLDLTEDVASTEFVKQLAQDADTALIPQCGLAPGFVSIAANHLAEQFHSLDSIRLCVGALPQYPSNSLTYNLTWSTDGVINEYCEPCIAIQDGQLLKVPALEQVGQFSLDGVSYETFNTSGGLGTLAETMHGRVRNLSYQTIRYPGHRDLMKTLLDDLQLRHRRDLLKDVLENALPETTQDVVLIFVTVSGQKEGHLMQQSYANKIYSRDVEGKTLSAIQLTTAASICAVLDLLAEGALPAKGFVRQEQITLDDFLRNRFGSHYTQSNQNAAAA